MTAQRGFRMPARRTDGVRLTDSAVDTDGNGKTYVRFATIVELMDFIERQQAPVTISPPEHGVPLWSLEVEQGPEVDVEDEAMPFVIRRRTRAVQA